MVNTLCVGADHGPDFHPLANHMTKFKNFTKGEIHEFFSISILTSINV